MQICHIQGIFSPEHGGPAKSLTNYCRSQTKAGHRVSTWVLDGFSNTSAAIRLDPPVEMHVCRVDSPARLGRSAALRRQLHEAEAPDIYHLHGAWLRAMHYGAVEARRRQRPYVLELMGMYEPWALRQKWLQKQIARWWFQDRILRETACLHVNSNQEAEYVRKLGFRAPLAVIPVGVDLENIEKLKAENGNPDAESGKQKAERVDQFQLSNFPISDLSSRPFILYLSRLHPKKGLDLLIRAYAALRAPHSGPRASDDWQLVIAGTGDPVYADKCRQLAEELGIGSQCVWLGHIDELQKTRLFANAHCYVLPTSSENFGNTVAEALAHGTPVITTRHTPWTDLPKHKCGWLVDNAEKALGHALHEVTEMDATTRREMGINGEKLARDHYSLELVSENILAVYEWVLGKGPKPKCVQTRG